MRAAYYEQNGPANAVLKLGEVETPRPAPGEVRVKLATSGVNPSDVKARSGATRKIAFPRVIPHSDGAGEIDLVGDGVSAARVGERVWVWNGQWLRPFGTCAEYIVLPAAQAVRLPAKTSFEVGACLGIPAMTAYHAIAVAGAAPGITLLIAGGAGAVGHHAVQFAKAAGASVIATVSSPEKADAARAAGADHTVDYRRENVGERVMAITAKKGVDAVVEVDFAANAQTRAQRTARARRHRDLWHRLPAVRNPRHVLPAQRHRVEVHLCVRTQHRRTERGAPCHHARARGRFSHHSDR